MGELERDCGKSLFDVYLNAIAMEGADYWEDADKLLELRARVAENMYHHLKFRDRLDHRLAALGVWAKTLQKTEDAA